MAEVQSRSHAASSRGRGGGRGGRGGFGSRNNANRQANGDKSTAVDSAAIDDDGDIGELRKQYGGKLDTIKELFPDWSDADILYALKETDGDVEVAATRIAEGTISQWGEVSKPKKTTTRPKPKDSSSATALAESSGNTRPARGGRSDSTRGARARGNERARGGRGRATVHSTTNGHQTKENNQPSVPTEDFSSWDNVPTSESATNELVGSTTETTTTSPPVTTATDSSAQPRAKTWASMLRASTTPKTAPKPKEVPVSKPEDILEPLPSVEPAEAEPTFAVEEPVEESIEQPEAIDTPKVIEPEIALPPPEDNLTKMNLEQLPDESHPPETATVASTAADSWDPRQQAQHGTAGTPISASQAQHQGSRPTTSGFAASALKATERPARMPSYQRRLLEQEEAVRMPGNREVNQAAVQFGAFSLNGLEDDIDGDREDPETRAQPPAESPIAIPRASLPPAVQPSAVPESFPTSQKPVSSLPQAPGSAGRTPSVAQYATHATNHHSAAPVAPPTGPAAATAQLPQAPSGGQQYGRYPSVSAQDSAALHQKSYESFTQQPATTAAGSLDSFPASTSQAPGPQGSGALGSAPTDYSSYYAADPQNRNTYGNFYGQHYGQQQGSQSHHDNHNGPNRAFSGYNATHNDNLSQYPQSAAQQSRYGASGSADSHNSGHNTPNPVGQTQQQGSAQSNQPQSNVSHPPPGGNFPYSHPYFGSPYYAQYMNQSYGGYNQAGYGGNPYGKGGHYGQHHQYGMSPQGQYDHGSSPAGNSGFGHSSLGGRDSGLGSSVDNYGRAGSGQAGAPGGFGGSSYGGAHDTFGRGSAYPSHGGQSYNSPNAQANVGSTNDDLKPYGDSKASGGPSPSLGAAARPGSTNNNLPAGSGLPPPQSAQQGASGYGYPSHSNHGLNQTASSNYGLAGSGAQGHGNNPYGGGYGNSHGFGNYYGGRQGQQGGGWGGNFP